MSATRKFLLNAFLTFSIGMGTAAIAVYTEEQSWLFSRLQWLYIFAFAIGIIIMPLHVLFNLALHLKGFIDIKRIPVVFLAAQSVILFAALFLVFYVESQLPRELTESEFTNRKYCYFHTASLVTYSYIPLIIYTIVTGRKLHRRYNAG